MKLKGGFCKNAFLPRKKNEVYNPHTAEERENSFFSSIAANKGAEEKKFTLFYVVHV